MQAKSVCSAVGCMRREGGGGGGGGQPPTVQGRRKVFDIGAAERSLHKARALGAQIA